MPLPIGFSSCALRSFCLHHAAMVYEWCVFAIRAMRVLFTAVVPGPSLSCFHHLANRLAQTMGVSACSAVQRIPAIPAPTRSRVCGLASQTTRLPTRQLPGLCIARRAGRVRRGSHGTWRGAPSCNAVPVVRAADGGSCSSCMRSAAHARSGSPSGDGNSPAAFSTPPLTGSCAGLLRVQQCVGIHDLRLPSRPQQFHAIPAPGAPDVSAFREARRAKERM